MTQPSDPSRLLRDPVGYANRPLEPEFDEYAAVREHVQRHEVKLLEKAK